MTAKKTEATQSVADTKAVPSCNTCKFEDVSDDGAHCICKRYPPTPTDAINANSPRVHASGWCGEWKART